jgi:hypothetical protein
MRIKQNLYNSLYIVLATVIITSCSSNSDNGTEGSSTKDSISTASQNEDTVNQGVLMSLPTPMQIGETYQKAGLKFIPNVTNDVSNYSKYVSTFSKTLNLGIYTADLAYCILNAQTQAALKYLKTAKQLSLGIGLASVYEASATLSRFEQNMNNPDSLEAIMRDLESESSLFMNEGDKKTQAIIIFAGVWLESIYVASNIVQNDKNKGIISLIGKQKSTLDKLVSLLSGVNKTDIDIVSLTNDFKSLKEHFETIEGITKQNSQSKSFEISISDVEITTLYAKIAALRTKIVS